MTSSTSGNMISDCNDAQQPLTPFLSPHTERNAFQAKTHNVGRINAQNLNAGGILVKTASTKTSQGGWERMEKRLYSIFTIARKIYNIQ